MTQVSEWEKDKRSSRYGNYRRKREGSSYSLCPQLRTQDVFEIEGPLLSTLSTVMLVSDQFEGKSV